MADAFVTKARTAGSCVVCNKEFKVGDELHMQNIGTEEAKKWLVSPHSECFVKIQANPELMKQGNSGFKGKPPRSADQREADAKRMIEKVLPVAILKACEIFKFDVNSQWYTNKDCSIWAQVLFKGMVEEYTR